MRASLVGIGVCILIAVGATTVSAATPEEIDKAIAKGTDWLYQQQKNGNWNPSPHNEDTGNTAICMYALLACNQKLDDPRMKAGLDYLLKNDTKGVYALGVRCIVWSYLEKADKRRQPAFEKDYRLLQEALLPDGHYHYFVKPDGQWDHSCSQYGVLGMWACSQEFPEIPDAYWQKMETVWKKDQNPDGGWNYSNGESTASMTAAGVATLFITQDFLHSDDGITCIGNIDNAPIRRGMRWMAEHIKTIETYYAWYGVERIGVASGYKYIGNTDWYQTGADFIIKSQQPQGGWWVAGGQPTSDTAFALLFLARGRAPVVMNKLQYENQGNEDTHWNQRPRDAANVTHFITHETEDDYNWQIVNLDVPVESLHDSPILYIAGDEALNLTKEQEEKLRAFVEQGGTIVGNPDCRNKSFDTGFRKLAKKLFPLYEFKRPTKDYILFNKPIPIRRNPDVQILSNGARDMMFLFGSDPAQHWQTRAISGDEGAFLFMENLFLSLSRKTDPLVKGKSYWVMADADVHPAATLHLARLRYPGNWDPEPGGWIRLGNVLHNANKLELTADAIDLGAGKLVYPDFKVADLTGTAAFTLKQDQRDELKKFVDAGGTLIIDAAGGSGDFASSFEKELALIFPDGKVTLLPSAHAILSNGGKPVEIAYRPGARNVIGGTHGPRMKGINVNGRTAVFISEEDLSVGLLGGYYNNTVGYESATATALMENMLQYALNPAMLAPPTSAPTSAPATAPTSAPTATSPATAP